MPELAEVDFFRRQWNPGIGAVVRGVSLHAGCRLFRGPPTRVLTRRLNGATLLESTAHGKQMLFRFSGGAWLGVHLGMTGALRVEPRGFVPGRHDHLVLVQSGRSLAFADPRQFGRVRFHVGPGEPEWWRDLPPSLTSPEFTLDRLTAFLQRHARAPIKAVLLSQEGFPGVGNWMADEILWRARLHPRLRAARVGSKSRAELWRAVRLVCKGALRFVAGDYSDPPTSWLFPHRWAAGGRCPRHQVILERATIAGRTTAWCARCQATS